MLMNNNMFTLHSAFQQSKEHQTLKRMKLQQ